MSAADTDADTDTDILIRQARAADHEAVAAFTRDTWSDRFDGGDYIADVFPEWVESDGPTQRTFVAEADGEVIGVCQCVLLSEHEAWAQGMRVHPDYRGAGVARRLNGACFDWARDRGATVCRIMVFSWNVSGLGAARGVGFQPVTEFRWAHVDPDPSADVAERFEIAADPDAAWSCWQRSGACDHLRGLTLDPEESWALSEGTRERFRWAAEKTAVVAVQDDAGTRAAAFRVRDFEREGDGEDGDGGSELWAEYAGAAWESDAAARALCGAIRRDAADLGADRTRILVPETASHVSDVVVAGATVSDHPDFVLAADLSV